MKYKKSSDFIKVLKPFIDSNNEVNITIHPSKYGMLETDTRDGEWKDKNYEIQSKTFLKNAELEWEEDLEYLLEELKDKEIDELNQDTFCGWFHSCDDGGNIEIDEDNVVWTNSDGSSKIELTNEDQDEIEELGYYELFENAGYGDCEIRLETILRIIVTVGNDTFALISDEFFDQCDENGNWL